MFAAGRSPRRAAVVATTGLLETLNRVELEGVLAHELCHVKNYDILPATVAVTALGALTVLGPLGGELMQFAVGSRREVLADAGAVLITRYPPGLSAALKKIQANPAVVAHARRTTAQLWFESPLPRDDHGRGSRLDRASTPTRRWPSGSASSSRCDAPAGRHPADTPAGPEQTAGTLGPVNDERADQHRGTARVKRGLAEMLRGGVIMDVVTPEQAKIAEDAGAVAVMALERVPSDIRRDGGVARMSDPSMIEGIQKAGDDPGHGQVPHRPLRRGAGPRSRSASTTSTSREVLTPADEAHHVDKWAFTVPFVCGATNLGEALRRIAEGAALIRSKGEAGTGNIVEAVAPPALDPRRHPKHHRRRRPEELYGWAKELRAPLDLVQEVAERGELPVPLFCAGGIATPADAALVMQLGAQAVFVGSGIFKCVRSRQAGHGDRRGHHALPRRRHRGQGLPRASARRCAARRSARST